MSRRTFDNRHYFGILALALICAGAGLLLASVIFQGICPTAGTAFSLFGIIAVTVYAPLIATAWRRADALACKRLLALRVAGLMGAIFLAAVLQQAVACRVEPDLGPTGSAIAILALWFAVLLYTHLYVGRYAEALRRQYDSRDEEEAA